MLFDLPWPVEEEHRGFILRDGGEAVGFLGTIFSRRTVGGTTCRFCNLSSWIVKESHRSSSLQLILPVLFGPVASDATAWRLICALDEEHLSRVREARATARRRVWELTGPPRRLILDIDATLLTAHSEKEGAAGTYKGGFGFHPLLCFEATTGEARGTQWYTVQAASFEMPSSMEIGLGYAKSFDEYNTFQVGAMFRNNNYQEDEYSFGGEYSFQNTMFVRGGYIMSPQTDKDLTGASGYMYDFTVGFGLHTNAGGVDLAFDYAYRHMKYFESNNVITMRVGF